MTRRGVRAKHWTGPHKRPPTRRGRRPRAPSRGDDASRRRRPRRDGAPRAELPGAGRSTRDASTCSSLLPPARLACRANRCSRPRKPSVCGPVSSGKHGWSCPARSGRIAGLMTSSSRPAHQFFHVLHDVVADVVRLLGRHRPNCGRRGTPGLRVSLDASCKGPVDHKVGA